MIKRNYHEEDLQITCVDWFRWNYPGEIIYAIPNACKRGFIAAKRLQKAGMLAGMPDLCIAAPRSRYGALYIEMKIGKNTTTEVQTHIIKQLMRAGNCVEVCYTFERFCEVVGDYMKETFFANQLREHNQYMRLFLKDYMQRTLDSYMLFCEADLSLSVEEQYNFAEFKHNFSECLAQLKNDSNSEELYKKVSDILSLATYYDHFFQEGTKKMTKNLEKQ
jgi:hypothetical protein